MTETQRLVSRLISKGHPLGDPIKEEEVAQLIDALRKRLGCTEEELDLSPESLDRLETELIALHQEVERGQQPLDEEETMRLIREMTAYLGWVMIVNLGGEWDKTGATLWPTMIWIPKPVKSRGKRGEVRTSSRRGFVAAHTATYFWDLIGTGQEQGALSKEYEMMTKTYWPPR